MSTKASQTAAAREVTTSMQYPGSPASETLARHVVTLKRSRTGVELPGWSAKIQSKEINATTPLTANEETLQGYSPGSFYCRRISDNANYYQNGISDSAFVAPAFQYGDDLKLAGSMKKARASALGKAYSKIQGVANPFGASVILGELKETIGFLRSPLTQTNNLAQALSDALLKASKSGKGIQKNNLALAKEFANSLLEFRFGIQPLISDSIAVLELASTIAGRNDVLTFRCYGVDEQESVVVTMISLFDGTIRAKKTVTTTLKTECVIRFGIKEMISGDGSKYDLVSEHLRDLANVPGVLWELTYLSWLVDYFVNINDVLTSIITSTKSVLWQCKSEIQTRTVQTVISDYESTTSQTLLIRSANQVTSFQNRTVNRTVDALTIPSVVLKVPGFKQIQNTAALLLQKLL